MKYTVKQSDLAVMLNASNGIMVGYLPNDTNELKLRFLGRGLYAVRPAPGVTNELRLEIELWISYEQLEDLEELIAEIKPLLRGSG
jgi:hypothetical protein